MTDRGGKGGGGDGGGMDRGQQGSGANQEQNRDDKKEDMKNPPNEDKKVWYGLSTNKVYTQFYYDNRVASALYFIIFFINCEFVLNSNEMVLKALFTELFSILVSSPIVLKRK